MQHRNDDTRVFGEAPEPGRGSFPGSVTQLAPGQRRASPAGAGEHCNGRGTAEEGLSPAPANAARSGTAWDRAKDVLLTLSTYVGPFAAFLDEVVGTIAGVLDAPHAEVLELTPDGFARRARLGLDHAPPSQLLPPDAGSSHAGYALSAGRILSVRNYGIETRFRVPEYLREAGTNTGITVPVRLPDGAPWGVVAVHDRPNRSFSPDARAFAEEVAAIVGVTVARERQVEHRCAQSDRKLEEERRSRRASDWRLRYFAETEQAAAMAETTAEAVRATVKRAVPALADWCYVDLIHEHPAAPTTIARDFVEHADDRPDSDEIADEFKRRYPLDLNAPLGTPKVLRTGKPELIAEITEEHLDLAANGGSARRHLFRRLGAVSFMCVPLEVGLRRVGALGFYSTTSGRRFDDDHLEMAHRLARILSLRLAGAAATTPVVPTTDPLADTPAHHNPLTPTQMKILRQLGNNKTSQQIASGRDASLSTVRNHITGIRQAFGVRSYEEAVDLARERGWLPAEPDS